MGSWELHNINLNVTQKARVVFEGVRGMNPSKGGFSLDDINLSSTKCPHHIWHIRGINELLATTPAGKRISSPRFVSPTGYTFQVNYYLIFIYLFNSVALKITGNTSKYGPP